MEQTKLPDAQTQLIEMRVNTMIQVILLGVIVGAITWLLTLLIDRFVISAIFCNAQQVAGICGNSTVVAGNVALVLTAIGGLLGLVRLGVYRPLLIVIAASIVLWGLSGWLVGLQWYETLAWTVLLYTVIYAAFSWLVRPRLFLTAIILVLIVVLAARILPALY
jgi:ABC-type uncharacterized transport system fused permease/ATPase subunit